MKREDFVDTALKYFSYIYMIIFALVCVIPFLILFFSSITSEQYLLFNGYSILPHDFSLKAYNYLFSANSTVGRAYIVSLSVTVLGTLTSMVVTCMFAFAISRKEWKPSNALSFLVFFTMLFSGGLVPFYLIITKYLHLSDTLLVLFLPYTVNAFNLLLLRNFFKGVDVSMLESAKIDGANDFRLLYSIVLPLSLPALATISLFYALQYWNDWYLPLLFLNKATYFPLQYLLRMITSNIEYAATAAQGAKYAAANVPSEGIKMATTIVTIGPIILLYPFLQKYFIKGLTIGAVKG